MIISFEESAIEMTLAAFQGVAARLAKAPAERA